MTIHDPHQSTVIRRFALATLGLPLLITIIGAALQIWARPDLPDPIAIHWGAAGRPDGFGSATATLILTIVVAVGIPVALAALVLPALRRGERGPSYRFMGAAMAATSALVVTLTTWLTVMQRGLDDAHDVGTVWWGLAAAVTTAALAGAFAWYAQPEQQQVSTTDM